MKILKYPNPLLRATSDAVVVTPEVVSKSTMLMCIMAMNNGIGLAAPQVGWQARLLVMNVGRKLILFNPTILEVGADEEESEEGCLSIPGVAVVVRRPTRVVVEAESIEDADMLGDQRPRKRRYQMRGLEARCVLHEIDHLNGVLMVDKGAPRPRS